MKRALKLKYRWEHEEIPAGKNIQRGLLIEVTGKAMDDQQGKQRPPLNLALVIDRSGSMQGDRLAAARKAAIGICRQLRKQDHLSIVAYDTELQVLIDGLKQNKVGRAAAESAIAKLQPGGCTDLGGGWMTGAKCAAKVMETEGFDSGHVLLLSDGHANHGMTDPGELAGHASELATRGVTSSCVGIGHDYSALQLNAIAEAGHGQLHHSDSPEEIVDIVLGELGDLTRLAARSVRLLLHFPKGARLKQLTAFREHDGGHYFDLDLGHIPVGRTRKVAFMLAISQRNEPGETLSFKAKLDWKDENMQPMGFGQEFNVKVVDSAAFDPKMKNRKVARVIAELWLARMGYEAMALNERGLFREAVDTFAINDAGLEELISELEEKEQRILMDRKNKAQAAVEAEWSGPSKLQAFSMAKKFMRSEEDHSGRNPSEWSDRAPK